MHNIVLSNNQVASVVIALEALRDHYAGSKSFMGQLAYQQFKETAEHVSSQIPEGMVK